MSIPVFRSYIKRKDMDTVLSCMMTDSVGPGEYLERFQKAAREAFGYEYGAFLRGPTEALGLALAALGLVEGDCVAVSALSPRWLAFTLEARKMRPLYLDVNPETGNPGPEEFAAASASSDAKPKCLIWAGGAGVLPDEAFFADIGIPVIEDVTRSLGAVRNGAAARALGTLAILSLEHGSIITSGGGALLYANGKREATVLRNLSEAMIAESRMTDFNASLGFAQLKELERAGEKRREIRRLFAQSLAGKRHRAFTQGGDAEGGCWSFPVVIESSLKDVIAYARKKDVETELAFADSCASLGLVGEGLCANARSLAMRTLLFPLHQRIGNAGAQKISRVLATLP